MTPPPIKLHLARYGYFRGAHTGTATVRAATVEELADALLDLRARRGWEQVRVTDSLGPSWYEIVDDRSHLLRLAESILHPPELRRRAWVDVARSRPRPERVPRHRREQEHPDLAAVAEEGDPWLDFFSEIHDGD